MKIDSRDFIWIQIVILVLLLSIMDCIIRGPMRKISKQLDESAFVTSRVLKDSCGGIGRRLDLLSELKEQEARQ
jgi:hypothetical protein